MNVKAVIMRKDRTLLVKYLSRKERIDNRIQIGNCTYLITKEDAFVITKTWRGPIRFNYITYYYREDDPQPLPVPMFEALDEGNTRQPISSEELNELFNPAFYRMVRGKTKDAKADTMYYMIIGILFISAYGTWKSHQIWGLIKDLVPGT